MMHKFQTKRVAALVGIALAAQPQILMAAEAYPALPPTLSTSVTPNVMLLIDSSASMLQDSNNNWMRSDLCSNPGSNWTTCINNNTNNWRTVLDSQVLTPGTKMNTAKRVAKKLIDENKSLRWGIFSFHVNNVNTYGGTERGEAGILQSKIVDPTGTTGGVSNQTLLNNAIDGIPARTATPLGESLLEVTRYFEGKSSLYSKITGNYESPIQYRCQKNFVIVLTDGDATNEDNLPGSGKSALSYTSYDANNSAITKSFSVCTSTGAGCPASLEGATTTPGFGTTSNRPRALRDVAQYALDADLRTTGNDADGKSFNDEAFRKQNLQTYTIGFGVDNEVLPAAAAVGGGQYFKAGNEATLTAALSDAVASIKASISNAGGVAASSDVEDADSYVFQPVFNPNGWYGELRRYDRNADGTYDQATKLEANALLTTKIKASGHAWRNIFTAKTESGKTTPLLFNDGAAGYTLMTSTQRSLLGANDTERRAVINYVRGLDQTGYRTRSTFLGDIINGRPVVVGKPDLSSSASDYANYQQDKADRSLVFVGANDGMMHGFNSKTMQEVVAYVPSNVFPRLKDLTSLTYGQAGTPHVYHVNGASRKADLKTGGAGGGWRTYLSGGLGQGGQGYYTLDVTDEANFAATTTDPHKKTVKWEWNDQMDPQIGYAFSAPIFGMVRKNSSEIIPVAIMTNGYENNFDDVAEGGAKAAAKSSALYIVHAETGELFKKISVPASGVTLHTSTGLSAPAALDFGQDSVIDYVYAGDENGNLWRFDLTLNGSSEFFVATNPIFKAASGQPIVQAPVIVPVNRKVTSTTTGTSVESTEVVGNVIVFGTGRLLTESDRLSTTTQALYGVLDTMADAPSTITVADLQQQQIVSTADVTDANKLTGTYRRVSNTAIDLAAESNTRKGWYVNLPDSSERLVSQPILNADNRVLFGTGVTQSTEKCLPGGKGWLLGLDALTGSIPRKGTKLYSFLDVNRDSKATDADKVLFGADSDFPVGFALAGIPTDATFTSKVKSAVGSGSSGGGSEGGGSLVSPSGAAVAIGDSNKTGVFFGNAKSGTTKSTFIDVPKPSGDGKLIVCTIGSENCSVLTLTKPGSGVTVERATWRELLS